jgi:hypothetical protein
MNIPVTVINLLYREITLKKVQSIIELLSSDSNFSNDDRSVVRWLLLATKLYLTPDNNEINLEFEGLTSILKKDAFDLKIIPLSVRQKAIEYLTPLKTILETHTFKSAVESLSLEERENEPNVGRIEKIWFDIIKKQKILNAIIHNNGLDSYIYSQRGIRLSSRIQIFGKLNKEEFFSRLDRQSYEKEIDELMNKMELPSPPPTFETFIGWLEYFGDCPPPVGQFEC